MKDLIASNEIDYDKDCSEYEFKEKSECFNKKKWFIGSIKSDGTLPND